MEENIQMLKELNENMQKLRNIENEINMLELALYQKNIEKILRNLKKNHWNLIDYHHHLYSSDDNRLIK